MATSKHLCYFTRKPVTLRELVSVDTKIANMTHDGYYESLFDNLYRMYPDSRKRKRESPYIHLNKVGKQSLVFLNISRVAFNKALKDIEIDED
jgi:hypothetical protein